ncbi:hypothetical protein UNPF46_15565 [Bradyrhizobium sp. UNPF46]|nr:hypothetical protein UNPF46_15565 [Bradyrhizobium sp. UNPF46]
MLLFLATQRTGKATPDAGSARAVPAAIFLAFDLRSDSDLGCVLQTASVSIRRSSALVLGACRVVDFCQLVMKSIWVSSRETPLLAFAIRRSQVQKTRGR